MNEPGITGVLAAELAALRAMPDSKINLTDIPEILDWQDAEIGKYYRPRKKAISLRVDLDVLTWFQSQGQGHLSRMNDALRSYMYLSLLRPKAVKRNSRNSE